uniref:eukaryotic translation initiation factor 4G-like isoform X2 n=1 Tax=Erigeron canadensis TaxID=72917 RepID=UPI001CB907D2|nr:eukaryotic translation initiation factor 4G-like isoform X2 [Erigeron canadensis]
MSVNQSRGADKNEFKRSGRSGNPNSPRNYPGVGGGKGGGGGGTTTAPPSGTNSYSGNKSFKKVVANNAQGAQNRGPGSNPNVNSNYSSGGGRGAPNGPHNQPSSRGAPAKLADSSVQKSSPGLPKAPQSHPASHSSGTTGATGSTTPVKGSGDASRAFPLQFGSINPGVMNGMQVPARTNSAPPNLDEQKRAQARLDSLKAAAYQNQAASKQHLTRKDTRPVDQPNVSEAPPTSRDKKEVLSSAPPVTVHSQKPTGPPVPSVPGVSMQMPFPQSQIHLPFGGPNPPLQSQPMVNTSLAVPLPMHIPQVQPQVFVPSIQHHQGIIHPSQGLTFSPQMAQLGNMGMGLGPQYPQQSMGNLNFGGARRTVKITHPDTHEELRLDKRTDGYLNGGTSGSRPHPHGQPQSQAVPSFPPSHPINYYPGYNLNPLYFPTHGGTQSTSGSQAPRFYNQPSKQVTVKPAVSHVEKVAGSSPSIEKSDTTKSQKSVTEGTTGQPHKDSETNSASSLPHLEKSDITKSQKAVAEGTSGQPQKDSETNTGSCLPQLEKCDTTESQEAAAEGTSGQPHKDSETNAGSSLQQLEKSDITNSQDAVAEDTSGEPNNAGSSLPQLGNLKNTIAASAPVEDCVPPVNSLPEVVKETMFDRSGLLQEEQKQPGKEVFSVPVDKIDGQSSFVSSLSVGHLNSKDIGVQETSKPSTLSMQTSNKAVPSNVADESVSRCESYEKDVDSTEIIGSGTHPDNPLLGGEPIAEVVVPEEPVKDPADQNQDSTVSDATGAQQKEPINDTDDKSSGSISTSDHGDQISNLDDHSNKFNGRDVDQVNNPVTSTEESPAISLSVPEAPSALEVETTGPISPSSSKVKGNASKGRKKIREILKNADARGTTSDLYNAYKRPEDKKDTSSAVENPSVNFPEKEVLLDEKRGPTKYEPDDWEDAADNSTPKMETGLKHHSEDDNEGMTKKYSRDFLLKFSDHCTDLPVGFEITPEITEALSVSGVNLVRDSYPSPGRGGDRAVSGPRLDRRLSNLGLDVSWNKGPGTMAPGTMSPGWDPRVEMNFPGRGVNHGVLRTPRGQPPGQYIGGILYGQMQSPGQLGVPMQRNNSDSDRWQRGTNFQKGLIPSPHTPVMHKAERKYEVGKITDQEQAKQRQLKGILNKLTPQNFEKLFDQVKQVNIDNADTLSGVIGQIFDKALMEPTFVEMYANFCSRLSVELPDFSENNEKITFKRLLLNKCQEEFERGEREEEEANRTEEEGEVKQTEEEREEKRVKARRRMLGNIRLIGELYKKRMLTERIMHECIKKLLGVNQTPDPDEENIEALCKLMSTIGEMIDHPKAKEHMDVYFDMMLKLSNNMDYSSRVRFMLKDAIDLRKNKWQQRRKVEGPKKIDEVHREAAQERQAQANRLARGPSSNPSTRRAQMDFGPRGSNVLPSTPQMGGYRGLPQQFRAYGNPDPRLDTFETRPLSVPLRTMNDDTITLGPQGGLARGMSIRGQPSMQGIPLHDVDSRRGVAGPNGYGSMSERAGYGQEDLASRWFSRPIYDPSNIQEQNMNYVNRDTRNAGRGFVQVSPSSPPEHARVTTPLQSGPSDTVMSEEHLHDKSIETIKEFYSARDEKEVALCIRDLNAPSFYPSMISIWVIDSFERKDVDRESLTKLLVNLARSRDGILSQESLVRGFESVLSTLEDAVNDAPKAAEFLGRIFAKVLLENVIPYTEVWRLIYEGGEEQGRLVEIGLAAEVLGVILEIIKAEKGDPFLNNMRMGSDLRLENFRPPTIKKTLRLDKFI